MTESSITERGAPEQAIPVVVFGQLLALPRGIWLNGLIFTSTHSARSILPISSFHPEIPPLNCYKRQAYLPPDF
jgi:hypothetical protein